jgi:hypothetical protein
MKSLILMGALLLLSMVSLISCSKKDEIIKELGKNNKNLYYLETDVYNGDGSKQNIRVDISNEILDSLKLSENKIKKLIRIGIENSTKSINFTKTLTYSEFGTLYYTKSKILVEDGNENIGTTEYPLITPKYKRKEVGTYVFSITGEAKNAYGVPDFVSMHVMINNKFKVIN